MKRLSKLSAWALTAILGLAAVSRAAAPLDNRVPQDAIVYFGWAGSNALQPQYAGSNLKAFIDASTAPDFIAQQLPKLIELAAKNDPTAPQTIAKLQSGLGIAWHHPTAFYFCPVDFANPQQPEFRFGLLCDAGADADTLIALLKETISQAPPTPELPMNVSADGALVGLTFGKMQTAAERQAGGTLATNPAYLKAMAHCKAAQPAFGGYIDFARGTALLNEIFAKVPSMTASDRAKAPAIFEALGLNGLTQMAMVNGFDGKEWSGQSFLGVSGPHKGILALLGSQPLSDTALSVVPKDAATFSTVKLDPRQIFTELRTVLGTIDAGALRQFDASLAQAPAQIGFNIEQDLLAPLGDEWIIYRAPLSDIGGNSFVLVHKLRDGDRFAKTLGVIEAMANKAGAGRFKIDKLTEGNIAYSSVTFMQYSLAWTVRNGYFYVSSMEGITGAIKQVENKLPSIVENELYKKALASVAPPGVKPISLTYGNPARLYPELRRGLLGLLPIARAAGFDIPASILPDTTAIAPILTPGAGIAWWDAEGLHQSSHASFPGAETIGGSSGGPAAVGVAAMGTAILLPSLGKARELSNRSVDAASLRGIAVSCTIFAADNNERYPDDLARLIATGQIAPKQLVSKRAGTAPLEMTPELEKLAKDDFSKFAEQVAQHCDFVYLGKGTTNTTDAGIVIAYEKPGPHVTDGMNLAFGDGHAEFVRWAGLADIFGFTNDMLKKKGLPTIDVQAILTQCGATGIVPQAAPVPNLP
jgi:prepilin-type processing-associated H-X9-DG protein